MKTLGVNYYKLNETCSWTTIARSGAEGVHLRMAVTPDGVITGVGFGAASINDQPLADTCLGTPIRYGR